MFMFWTYMFIRKFSLGAWGLRKTSYLRLNLIWSLDQSQRESLQCVIHSSKLSHFSSVKNYQNGRRDRAIFYLSTQILLTKTAVPHMTVRAPWLLGTTELQLIIWVAMWFLAASFALGCPASCLESEILLKPHATRLILPDTGETGWLVRLGQCPVNHWVFLIPSLEASILYNNLT